MQMSIGHLHTLLTTEVELRHPVKNTRKYTTFTNEEALKYSLKQRKSPRSVKFPSRQLSFWLSTIKPLPSKGQFSKKAANHKKHVKRMEEAC